MVKPMNSRLNDTELRIIQLEQLTEGQMEKKGKVWKKENNI